MNISKNVFCGSYTHRGLGNEQSFSFPRLLVTFERRNKYESPAGCTGQLDGQERKAKCAVLTLIKIN